MAIKLVSINIEGQKHLETVKAFLARETPDVVCLQECFGDTIDELSHDYPYRLYGPTYLADQNETGLIEGNRDWGEVLISKTPLENPRLDYLPIDGYGPQNLPRHGQDNHVVCLVRASVKGYQVGTTHFTWTPKGTITKRQREHMRLLLDLLKGEEIVMAGDFNIPRGNQLYKQLAVKYRDNIPLAVSSTLDPVLHYANAELVGQLKLVVDYIWSTPKYSVGQVRVESGVSDHCALVCSISLV